MLRAIFAIFLSSFLAFGCKNQASFDLIISGGTIVDGSGAEEVTADIGVRQGIIVEIGDLAGQQATQHIEAHGLIVCPGFIDLGNLSIRGLQRDLQTETQLQQGITTVLLNSDGGILEEIWPVAAYLHQFELKPPVVNIAVMVSHNTIRRFAIPDTSSTRPATAAEVDFMRTMIDRAMRDGAFGLSTALSYAPARFADRLELVSLCKRTSVNGGRFFVGLRNPLAQGIAAINEVAEFVPPETEAPVFITNGLLTMFAANRQRLQELTGYLDRHTSMRLLLPPMPAWYGELTTLVPEGEYFNREQIRAALRSLGGADRIRVVNWPAQPAYLGKTLQEIALQIKRSPVGAFMQLVKEVDAMVAVDVPNVDEYEAFLTHEQVVITSGGGTDVQTPNGVAAFPYFLKQMVYIKERLSLPQAVQKLTSQPASILGLHDRGLLRPGFAADLAIFDPAKIGIRDWRQELAPKAGGMHYVIVNGVIVYDKGRQTEARPGRPLFSPPPRELQPEVE